MPLNAVIGGRIRRLTGEPSQENGTVLTYSAKLLLIPTLVVVATLGLVMFLACRGLIGLCTGSAPEEDPAG
jgi:hypothetical protein